MNNPRAGLKLWILLENLPNLVFAANDQEPDFRKPDTGKFRPGENHGRPMIAAHGVERDRRTLSHFRLDRKSVV